ncbi:TraR/DksA family transcriptional regulator [Salinibacterium hongtaonis]|uniref:Zinc finger DksA/TraR C4-type domain-containing protein n=1 Tax=Homoserinimonas hongtaonis TaxID=2079791 RepID=A0A2U1T080_9MICO|nr:TraR/DksA C4-type zinc finger protein [Salinibacterium hongtaonis]AWB89810.1 hypothetical protein C2138_09925 [Salinibacterium hongtaonis]PWB97267.1 hypothetical protein DF220_05070 [Salinibacterium hongtaonis]
MRFSDARLEGFREQLLSQQRVTEQLMADLGSDIRLIVEARHDSNVDDEHDPEGATIAFERSQTDALLKQSTQRLGEISAALRRIDLGTFGTCVNCGQQIAVARLDARAYAATCIDCAR